MDSAKSYWRDRLPASVKSSYDSMVRALEHGDKSCPLYTLDQNLLAQCFSAVTSDNPQLFWLSQSYSYSSSPRGIYLELKPLYGDFKIPEIRRECDRVAAAVRGNSPLETEKNIAEYIVRNVTYEVDNKFNQNMASALYYKKAQCSGIAAAVKYLCDKNGIWCIIVTGTLENEPHAWNIVCIDGFYYHLDVTSMLGSNEDKPRILRYAFVNYADRQLSQTHTWDRSQVPACPNSLEINEGPSVTTSSRMRFFTGRGNAGGNTGNASGSTGGNTPQNRSPHVTQQHHVQTQQQRENIPAGTPEFTNMSALRAALGPVFGGRQSKFTFVLKVGADRYERMNLISSSVKMAVSQYKVSATCKIEIMDTLCTLYFEYI